MRNVETQCECGYDSWMKIIAIERKPNGGQVIIDQCPECGSQHRIDSDDNMIEARSVGG